AVRAETVSTLAGKSAPAVENGVGGRFNDDIAHFGEWGFDLADTRRPVTIWQGRQDRFVPAAHGEWLASRIPGARAQLRPEHGHLSLAVSAYAEVLDELIASGS